LRLLIADDDPTIRTELSDLLREEGHEVSTAADGAEAIRKLESGGFDAALLDLKMPRSNGLEVLRRIRVVHPETAVIMITGQGTVDAAVEAMKLGATDFVEKPFEIESIQRTLESLAEERQARRLLSLPSPDEDSVAALFEEAARRGALLVVGGAQDSVPWKTARVLRIAEEPRPSDVYSPNQLYQLNATIEAHIVRADAPVVYLGELGAVERTHGRSDLKAWIRQLAARCEARGGTLVVAPHDPALASELQSEAGDPQVDAGLQGMLESLANPIRRAIVSFVYSSGPVAYSAILRKNFVDSSSKLSFHLQKLKTDTLLMKLSDGAYALTEDGRRAWRVVQVLSEQRRRPSFVVVRR